MQRWGLETSPQTSTALQLLATADRVRTVTHFTITTLPRVSAPQWEWGICCHDSQPAHCSLYHGNNSLGNWNIEASCKLCMHLSSDERRCTSARWAGVPSAWWRDRSWNSARETADCSTWYLPTLTGALEQQPSLKTVTKDSLLNVWNEK